MTRAGLRADDIVQVAVGIVGDCADAAFLVGGDGTVIAWNSRATELFGVPAWEASAHQCEAIIGGRTAAGAPLCQPNCPILAGAEEVPGSFAMQVRCGLLGRTRPVRMHHLPIRHPKLGTTIAMLHVVDS